MRTILQCMICHFEEPSLLWIHAFCFMGRYGEKGSIEAVQGFGNVMPMSSFYLYL